jgi:hypothetical protein
MANQTLKFRCIRNNQAEQGDNVQRELQFSATDKQGQPLVGEVQGNLSLTITGEGSDVFGIGDVIVLSKETLVSAPAKASGTATPPATA